MKFKLQPEPTFNAKVPLAVPGEAGADVQFTFKYRDRDELKKFIAVSAERGDVETILEMASGWELSDTYSKENVELLVRNCISAPRAIFDKYVEELTKARLGN